MFTADVKNYIDRSVLCWLATVDAAGAPNVSPKEVFAAFGDETLLVANIMSPGSARNARANPKVCVSFVDVFTQRGYKLRGTARLFAKIDPRFAEFARVLDKRAQGFPIQSIFEIAVSQIEPILAPSYRMVPGTTEETQIAGALKTYGVTKKSPHQP
jgi:predicted pyridoxine 5'-phosphate oxidase superfamily flavin-nucleotide-binding protein